LYRTSYWTQRTSAHLSASESTESCAFGPQCTPSCRPPKPGVVGSSPTGPVREKPASAGFLSFRSLTREALKALWQTSRRASSYAPSSRCCSGRSVTHAQTARFPARRHLYEYGRRRKQSSLGCSGGRAQRVEAAQWPPQLSQRLPPRRTSRRSMLCTPSQSRRGVHAVHQSKGKSTLDPLRVGEAKAGEEVREGDRHCFRTFFLGHGGRKMTGEGSRVEPFFVAPVPPVTGAPERVLLRRTAGSINESRI